MRRVSDVLGAVGMLGTVAVLCAAPSVAVAAGSASGATSTATPAVGAPGSNPLGNPITPGLPQSQASPPTTSTPTVTTTSSGTSTTGGSGLGTSQAIVIVGFAAVLLVGVSFFIWRDARRRAPVRAHRAAAAGAGPNGSRRAASKQRVKPRKLSPAERRRRKRGRAR
jgi:hypothetical protein